jgi:hypothetical protein
MLLIQHPPLIRHFYDTGGLEIEDWFSGAIIQNVFAKVLEDPELQSTYLIVDTLDECLIDSDVLLEFIVTSAESPVKWIVSSRNQDRIKKAFSDTDRKISLSLESNAQQVSQAVDSYIEHRVSLLSRKRIKEDELKKIQLHLFENSHGTFLQVSLVCEYLKRLCSWEILRRLKEGKLMAAGSPTVR